MILAQLIQLFYWGKINGTTKANFHTFQSYILSFKNKFMTASPWKTLLKGGLSGFFA